MDIKYIAEYWFKMKEDDEWTYFEDLYYYDSIEDVINELNLIYRKAVSIVNDLTIELNVKSKDFKKVHPQGGFDRFEVHIIPKYRVIK